MNQDRKKNYLLIGLLLKTLLKHENKEVKFCKSLQETEGRKKWRDW